MFEFIKRIFNRPDQPKAEISPATNVACGYVSAPVGNPDLTGSKETETRKSQSSALQVEPRDRPRSASRARELELKGIPCIRLPKAPEAWDEHARTHPTDADHGAPTPARNKLPLFRVSGERWTLAATEKLTAEERPDVAFREGFLTASSSIWLDKKGRSEGPNAVPAIAQITDRNGIKVAERGLAHSIYRTNVNGDGSGMLFLSGEGVLHAYTGAIEPILEKHVEDLPEYQEQAKRFGIDPERLRYQVRCVALSQDRSRWLVTVVDEAWCFDLATARPVWGLRFPTKDGWTEVVAERSNRTGASSEVLDALRLMELELPVTPEQITKQYRTLALRWHPDRNPNDSQATRRFQNLGAAMELLTGADLSNLSDSEVACVSYQQILSRTPLEVTKGLTITLTMSLQVGGAWGADWIYAAEFAQDDNTVFLAGYSGRVVEVGPDGHPVRIYDVGTVPKQVTKTSSHLFILTSTRLYVLKGDELVALVDVMDQGKLIVGECGFGLMQSKCFRWFSDSDAPRGVVRTRDPIRRVYFGTQGLTIETRTHRAIVSGAQSWWR